MSGRATPKRVAPLPARCARQMFFVADYDAVCAIMTTSLFLSPASSLSIYLAIISLPPISPTSSTSPAVLRRFRVPRRFPLGGCGFFPSLCLFFRLAPLSSPCRRGQTLLLPQPLATTSSRTRQEATKLVSLSRYEFLAVYTCTRGIFGFSFSRLLLYISYFISFPLRSTASIG